MSVANFSKSAVLGAGLALGTAGSAMATAPTVSLANVQVQQGPNKLRSAQAHDARQAAEAFDSHVGGTVIDVSAPSGVALSSLGLVDTAWASMVNCPHSFNQIKGNDPSAWMPMASANQIAGYSSTKVSLGAGPANG